MHIGRDFYTVALRSPRNLRELTAMREARNAYKEWRKSSPASRMIVGYRFAFEASAARALKLAPQEVQSVLYVVKQAPLFF